MWGVGGLEVHWICNFRLVYREVVEADQNVNLTCEDLEISLVMIRLGVTALKKLGSCISRTCSW